MAVYMRLLCVLAYKDCWVPSLHVYMGPEKEKPVETRLHITVLWEWKMSENKASFKTVYVLLRIILNLFVLRKKRALLITL